MGKNAKGEVTAKYEGQSYKLVLNFNALCDFEDATGLNGLTLVDQIEAGNPIDARDMRHLIWAALRQHHPEATVELAGLLYTHNQKEIGQLLGTSEGKPEAADVPDPLPEVTVEPVKPKRKTSIKTRQQ
ncbi:GTA-gp10 family protein [Ketogulonicigenium vulgare]|uniref:GTA-gp10 family protein n=1 Tax=Ketogulonicigenium vulgare TaxID=92945 RepID=UPI002358F09B|nr:GTA-gp10 family protein [Ketogulonicigenium vulgare]